MVCVFATSVFAINSSTEFVLGAVLLKEEEVALAASFPELAFCELGCCLGGSLSSISPGSVWGEGEKEERRESRQETQKPSSKD